MNSPNSRPEYERRFHRVQAHIDLHLDEALDLNTLAGVAHFSPFHFHRLFLAWMGETLGDYLRRRRLEVAAMRLAAQPRITVLNVALSVGFGSAEAFARAFKTRFGHSPSAWRAQQREMRRISTGKDSKLGQVNRKPNQAGIAGSSDHPASSTRNLEPFMNTARNTQPGLNVKIIDRQPTTVAYLRYTGPYGAPVNQFWQTVYYPWAATHNLLHVARYGISHDDPGITAPQACRYDACAEVPVDFVASGGALKTVIPGGKYAALAFKGRGDQFVDAWAALLRDWLPDSGLQLDARPSFEYYSVDSSYDPKTGVMGCDICIPVVPL
jgi:AraC family transcriptional regulator